VPGRRKNPDRYRSLAHYFGARIRDLRDSYEERIGRPLGLNEFAARTGYSRSMISAIERGEHLPENGDRVRLIDHTLKADGELTGMWPLVQRLGRRPIDELIAAADSGNNHSVIPQGQDDDMQRRLLFRLTGLGLISGPALSDAEALRQLIEKAIGTAESSSVEDWEAACLEHQYAAHTHPPAQVREQLVSDIAALQWSLAHARPEHRADLQRSMAWLSRLHAGILTDLGEFGQARRWWATARRAADASGDLDMRVRVRGKEAVLGLYAHRPLESVISLSRKAQHLAGGMTSTSVLQALAGEVQALALTGRDQEAQKSLKHLLTLADKIGDRREFGWHPDSTWFVASWVHSFGGSAKAAEKAREEAFKRLPGYHNDTNLRLHRSITIAREGGHTEALRQATEVVSNLAPAYRSQLIMHTARQVQEYIPPAQRKGSAFDDYRTVVLAASA
jgi:transcriptional regulator with XRE-family HTH domain